MSKPKNMIDNISALGALALSALAAIGSAIAYLENRRRHKHLAELTEAQAKGESISNVIKLSERLSNLEDEREKDYVEREKMKEDLAKARAEIRKMRAERTIEQIQRERMERLLIVAIEYIDILTAKMVELGVDPPAKPPEIEQWMEEHNGAEHDRP